MAAAVRVSPFHALFIIRSLRRLRWPQLRALPFSVPSASKLTSSIPSDDYKKRHEEIECGEQSTRRHPEDGVFAFSLSFLSVRLLFVVAGFPFCLF